VVNKQGVIQMNESQQPMSIRHSGPHYEGLEIGAVSIKWVRRSADGTRCHEIVQHGGNPTDKLLEIFEKYKTDTASQVVVTGETAKTLLNLPYRSETQCLEKALEFHGAKPDILLSLGGETFSVYPMKAGRIKNIFSTSKCAAGTGEFIAQQFQRMGMSLTEGLAASREGNIVQLASRCSVHCKSDATHKLNKGECSPSDIARSLIHDLAKKVAEMVLLAQWSTGTIVITGGVTLNEIFVEYLRNIFADSRIVLLPESPYFEAFGAALYASELSADAIDSVRENWIRDIDADFEILQPLKDAEPLLDYRVVDVAGSRITDGVSYILAVDAGSTTTKAVLMNASDGSIGASCYLRTLGNPIAATKKCLIEIQKQVGDKHINIIQAGTTGSARELVSVFFENCPSFNEILAHARAAAQEVPEVDTVFEIGGQDSKFISFLNGVPVDYAMNEGCSAGTGSFLEESAFMDMGVATEEISGIAENSTQPLAFGQRCAAFINTDLRNALQQGARQDDVVAGLVYSIADNYSSRIVGPRHIGENLLFMGGVALNKSVALALAARTRRKIVVPPHPELMGSVGTALMAADRLRDGDVAAGAYDLASLAGGEMQVKGTFRCKACENNCEIQKIEVHAKIYPFGGFCSKYENLRHAGEAVREGRDLVGMRNRIMFGEDEPTRVENARGTIGLPMVLTTFELYSFYAKLIEKLGFEMVTSNPSKTGNRKATGAICYPCEIVHGAVYDLIEQGVDYIFLPRTIEIDFGTDGLHGYTCTSTAVIPDVIRAAFEDAADRILSPHIGLTEDLLETTLQEIGEIGVALGLTEEFAIQAAKNALQYFDTFKQAYREQAGRVLDEIKGEPTVILAGRPYTTCSNETNLALPRKITSRGYHVIPADMLPDPADASHPRDVWHYTQQISNAVAHVKNNPNFYVCLVSCFSCAPDSSMYHYFRQELAGQTFCYLEIDSHTAHAGFDTRVGAFLDIIDERRRKQLRDARGQKPHIAATADLKGSSYMPARLGPEMDCIIDSDGNRVAYDDPRVVHVWTINHSALTVRMIAKVYETSGRQFRGVEQTSAEVMQDAKKLCSGRECVPMTAMTGAAVQDILNRRQPGEITIYFNLDQQGPCQNGAWPLVWETFCNRLKAKNVIAGIMPTSANNRLGLDAAHMKGINQAVLLGDLLTEALLTLRCIAQDTTSALQIFETEFNRFIECFKQGDKAIKPALSRWAENMAGIPLRASVRQTPKVLIFGGLNLLFVHKPVTDYFLNQGVLPKLVDFNEGACWIESEDIARFGFKKGLTNPEDLFDQSPRKKDGPGALAARKSKIGLLFIDSIQKQFREIMQKSGLLFDEHIPFANLASAGHKYISYNAFTESSTTVGRYVCAVESGLYDGLVNLGSFNCQPAMNSQAILRPLVNKSNIAYAALDCEGPWISTNQRRLLESIAVQAKRTRAEKDKMATSG
jgi:predicted CoA-substrate-specific enzyme activase